MTPSPAADRQALLHLTAHGAERCRTGEVNGKRPPAAHRLRRAARRRRGALHLALEQAGVLLAVRAPGGHERLERGQAGLVVVAQAARVVVPDVRELRALRADLQHLVDLLLVLHHTETHLGVVDRKDAFTAHGVLVQRHRNGAQRLGGQHGGVQARAVGADHHHVFAALQAGLVQAAGHRFHQLRHRGPGGGLPDAVFLLAHGRRGGAAFRVFQQEPGESRLHGQVSRCGAGGGVGLGSFRHTRSNHSGADGRHMFDVMLSVRRQLRVLPPWDFP